MNEAATFVGAASIAAGCPNILDPFPPPLLVGPLADPRCGNDAQALGHFTNGGTYPASSTLENRGVSLVAQLGRQRRRWRSSRSPPIAVSNGPARVTPTTRRC